MARGKGDDRIRVKSTGVGLEFELPEEQRKAVIDCIQRTGKISLKLTKVGVSKLPGRGLLDDVEGELID